MCARLCVCMEQLGSHWTNFKLPTLISDKPSPPPTLPYKPCYDEMWYLMILGKSFEKIQHSLKFYKNNWYFTWSLCTVHLRLSLLPLGATALGEPWPPQQSVSISLFHLLHPLLYLHYFQVCYHIIHPSQTRSSFSSSYKQSSFHHLSWHRSHFHFLYTSQSSYFLSFYIFHNILSLYGSIQFFIISNSLVIHLSLYLFEICSDWEMFTTEFVDNIRTHRMFSNVFPNVSFMR